MNNTAYVVCGFTIVDGVPVFKGAGIFSEDAGSLTHSSKIVLMDLFKFKSSVSYQAAHDGALVELARFPDLKWMLPFLACDKPGF